MKNEMKRMAVLLLALCLVAGLLGGCAEKEDPKQASGIAEPTAEPTETQAPTEDDEPQNSPRYIPTGNQLVDGKEYGIDYISLYDQFGAGTSIKDVTEDPETGLVYLNAPDGKQYELGLDFLSMAMVYNTDPTGSVYDSEEDVYAAWWRYYVTRWNMLLPEIPLYCEEYYDVFSSKITGVEEHPTNPYWGPARALLYWASEKEDNSLILGSTEELTGKFRFPGYCTASYDSSSISIAAGDRDICSLITGLETVVTDREGRYIVNPTAVKDLQTAENEDGTVTYTITIYDDLKFSDGSPVTAKNYLYFPMVFSSHSAALAVNTVPDELRRYVGYEGFHYYGAYEEGTKLDFANGIVVSKVFPGLRLLDDYRFSVTVTKDYVPYFFARGIYPAFAPTHKSLWIKGGDIADDGEGCYFTDDFWSSGQVELIQEHAIHADPSVPCAGPYCFDFWDEDTGRVILRRNPYFKGNYEGVKPSIETVIWQAVDPDAMPAALESGAVDYLSTVREPEDIDELLALQAEPGAIASTHYTRAGYGKLAFRCDFGPVQFPEVRQAIALCMDRTAFADEYTGGLGGIVDGPYYTGSWMYKAAVRQGMTLDPYTTSPEEAVRVLEEGGWIYDKDGKPYTQGVRYKKIPGEYATETDILYKSPDGEYVTAKVGDDYYMPLVLNWFGSEENSVTPVLERRFEQNELLAAAGFQVEKRIGPFQIMFDEFYQNYPYSGFWQPPSYNVFNFAANFDDPGYDCSFKMTVDPDMYDNYSAYFFKDPADLYWKE